MRAVGQQAVYATTFNAFGIWLSFFSEPIEFDICPLLKLHESKESKIHETRRDRDFASGRATGSLRNTIHATHSAEFIELDICPLLKLHENKESKT